MSTITPIPELVGITSHTEYDNGLLRECSLNERNVIHTSVGDLVPHFSSPDERSKDLKSISYYESGAIRSISLDKQTEVSTPIGEFPAELVTFYEDGTMDSVFPLNGQIGFTWSEKDEERLAESYSFEFSFDTITAKTIGVRFFHSGAVKSLIWWPDEIVQLDTPTGKYPARTGIRLFEDGRLRSFEPAVPIIMKTPVGIVQAFDVEAVTIDADENSVRFDHEGHLAHLATAGDVIIAGPTIGRKRISSLTRMALGEDKPVKLSISIDFGPDTVTFDNGEEKASFSISENRFLVMPDISTDGLSACDLGCDSCDLGCA
ncbi:hypothetical protein [Propionibacterium sp.]|uniref:hypothetical protein n=1 Tax=Propionibacterium sp. TaxID=1977903 RepID=UPI0039ED271F